MYVYYVVVTIDQECFIVKKIGMLDDVQKINTLKLL